MNKSQQADVSVVMPVYNSSATLTRALASVSAQTMQPREVIIVDDASSDDSVAAVRKYTDNHPELPVNLIRHDKNRGAASARNTGWAAASARYIAFLDADDAWHHDKIRIQYGWMAAHPEYGISGHACPEVKNLDDLGPAEEGMMVIDVSLFRMLLSNRFLTPTVMLRQDITARFTDDVRHAEDYLLWLQIVSDGTKAAYINQPLAGMFKPVYGYKGLSANLWEMEKGVLNAYQEIHKKGHVNLLSLLFLSIYSLLKYIRRIAIVMWRSWFFG